MASQENQMSELSNYEREVLRLLTENNALLNENNSILKENHRLLVAIDDNVRKIKFNTNP
jgi:hypothetical protein